MMRIMRINALLATGIIFAQGWVPQALAASHTAVTVMSRTARSRVQPTAEVALDNRLAREWGLRPDEWVRYRRLMQGPLGIWSPHLDPLTALGIEARSASEREHYAALEVRMEGERVQKILTYQRAYDDAWKRLYPTLEPVEFSRAPHPRAAAPPPQSSRLAVFVKDPCAACDAIVAKLQRERRKFDIYMVGLQSDADIRAWAAHVGIQPALVRARVITLNHDAGRWLSIGDQGPLPAVLGYVNGRWQRE
jgi:integrating conjugative element protein (TIGR03759 family)